MDSMASALLESFRTRSIDLYPEPDLIRDLSRLRIVEKSYGFRLEATRDATGHADRATALTLALLGSRRFPRLAPTTVDRPLVCWPA
jgi:hypothetical protein